jgi:hypothetical protein
MNPYQRHTWEIVSRHDTFELADAARAVLKAEGKTVKVHHMGNTEYEDKQYFAVKVGTPVVRKDTDEQLIPYTPQPRGAYRPT